MEAFLSNKYLLQLVHQCRLVKSAKEPSGLSYPGSCAMKRLEVFVLPLDGMLVHCRVTPSIKLAYLYTWVERGTVRVKCCVPEHSNVPSQGLYPDFLISRDKRNNHETTHLPQFTSHLLQNVFSDLKFCADFKVALPKHVLPVIANYLK